MSETTLICRSCAFWKPYREKTDTKQPDFGECRRRDPRLKFDRFDNDNTSSEWPPTEAGDWCGEHRPGTMPLPLDGEKSR